MTPVSSPVPRAATAQPAPKAAANSLSFCADATTPVSHEGAVTPLSPKPTPSPPTAGRLGHARPVGAPTRVHAITPRLPALTPALIWRHCNPREPHSPPPLQNLASSSPPMGTASAASPTGTRCVAVATPSAAAVVGSRVTGCACARCHALSPPFAPPSRPPPRCPTSSLPRLRRLPRTPPPLVIPSFACIPHVPSPCSRPSA
jgi:hypothetical protein